jgi:phage baseplate assembly protein W
MSEVNALVSRQRVFKDISLTMAKNPVNRDIVAVTGDDAVKRAIKNILMTQTGEIPFFPAFGSRIRNLLFEQMDPITIALLQSEILNSLATFEPRCRVLSLIVDPDEENNSVKVNLTLQLLNQIAPISLTLFLSRLR